MMQQMQQMRLLRDAQSDAARLNIADAARAKGDYQVACRIYLSLAGSRPANPATVTANERLIELGQEARKKLADVEERLGRMAQYFPQ